MGRMLFFAWMFAVGLPLATVFGQGGRANLPLALRFDPVFRISQISGEVFVLRPGELPAIDPETGEEYLLPAREMRGYPYGTRVTSSPRGAGLARFSRFSEMAFSENTDIVVGQNPEDTRRKDVRVASGRLSVKLEQGIEENGNALALHAPSVVCHATNMSVFSMHVRPVHGRMTTDIVANDGSVRLLHPDLFEIVLVAVEKGRDLGVRVITSPDGNFVDLQGLQGNFGVKVRDPHDPDAGPPEDDMLGGFSGGFGGGFGGGFEGLAAPDEEIFEGLPKEEGYRIFKMTPGFNIKFSKRRLGQTDTLLVTILTIDADGEIKDEITYKEGAPPPPSLAAEYARDPFGALPMDPVPEGDAPVEEIDLGDFGFDF